jgi:hypothetical protein
MTAIITLSGFDNPVRILESGFCNPVYASGEAPS